MLAQLLRRGLIISFSYEETGGLESKSLRWRWKPVQTLQAQHHDWNKGLCMTSCLHHRKWNTLVGKTAHVFIPQMGKLRPREEKTTQQMKAKLEERPQASQLSCMGQARVKNSVASSLPWAGVGGNHSKESALIQTPQSIHTQAASSLHLQYLNVRSV